MSLAIRKGVPTRMSTSRSSTTRASRASCFSAWDKMRQISLATAKGSHCRPAMPAGKTV